MKITKKIEAEIKLMMEDYWDSYLKGNLKHWASYLVDDYQNIGTTEVEIWKSKKEIYNYSTSVLDQMVGLTELRNKKTEIIPYDPYVMVHEFLDIYIKAEEEWIFYSKVRMSSLIQKINRTWKILHQHGSYPDSKVTDGEFFAFDRLKSENLKLQESVKNRTLELELSNRELEIEAALEKVRAIALSMKEPADMLDLCKSISQQLQSLGVKEIRNVQTAIFYEQRGTYMNYEYYSKHKKTFITETVYTNNKIHKAFALKMLKGKGEIFTTHIKGRKVKEWIEYQKTTNVFIDRYLNKASSLNYYWFSLGPVALGISTYHPLTEEETNLFNRFLKVFELAYQRYLDIEKAEDQAREAKVEAALERVRSLALGMRKSEEVGNVTDRLFTELINLSVYVNGASIVVINEDNDKMELWRARSNVAVKPFESTSFAESMDILKKYLPDWFPKFFTALGKRKNYLIDELSADRRLQFINAIAEQYKYSKEEKSQLLKNAPINITTHFIFFKLGYLALLGEKQLSTENLSITRRFVEVFDFSYTRFLDLQNAEKQAREAKIEAALERVRAKAMAMHNSADLSSAASMVFTELRNLGINPIRCGVGLIDKESRKTQLYSATSSLDGDNLALIGSVVLSGHPILEKIYDTTLNNEEYFPVLSGEQLKSYYELLLKGLPVKVPALQAWGKQYGHFFPFSVGGLYAWSESPYNDAELIILRRFAAIIDLTFRRYIELQKAEAQTREAQIEAALERVRSRSMGMLKSEELKEVIQVVYEQLVQLHINIEHSGFIMDFKTRDDMHIWLADRNEVPSEIVIPYFDSPHWNSFNEAKANGKDFFANHLSFEEKNKFYQDLFEYIPGVPGETKEYYFNCPGLAISTVLLENVGLYIENFSGTSYSDEENKILMRFGKVFQQTYTRFLDLQKAEVQAREAQIEAALEKVRSRSLAMHKSDEIQDVVVTVMEKMNELNIEMNGGVSLATYVPDSNDLIHWYVNPDHVDGPVTMHLPYFENVLFSDFIEARKSGKEILPIVYSFEEKNKYFEYAFEHSDFRIVPEELKKWILEQPYFGYSVAIQKHSAIFFNDYSGKVFTEKENEVLIRFAKVFDQAYIRFLDLQKAEAQSRQAQIETAMEKVRARALAMQKPEELIEVAQVLRKEMSLLGVEELETSSIYIHDEDSGTTECWYAIQDIREEGKKLLTDHMTINLKDTLVGREMMKFYSSDENQTSILMQGENRKEWINYCAEHSEALQGYYGDIIPERTYHLLKFSNGFMGAASPGEISAQSWELLERATSVFSFAYTRFRDLQQAEARAVEAMRQASLDRVRAEIASMRSTDDLEKITPLIWRELTALGVPFFRCGVFIIDEINELVHAYLSTPEGNSLAALQIKLEKGVWVEKAVQNWRMGQIYYEVWDREKFLSWTQVMMDEGFVENKERFQDGKDAPENLSLQLLPFNQGMLYIGSEERLSEEEIELGQKLANDFGIAYSRYEDFQKLEEANNRKSLELEEARQLQLGMLPNETPKLNNLEIAAYMETATEVGGDYYDFNIDEDGSLTVVVGDATGHGMKAGTIVTITKSLFNSSVADSNIVETFSKISKVIKDMKFRQLSMCLLMLKIKDYKLSISSAAMPPIFIYRSKSKSVDEILIKGMPLGAISNFPYSSEETKLQKGDNILLMSDGFPELMNGDGEIFGYERTRKLFGKIGNKKPDEIISKLNDAGKRWLNGREPDDDVTFVVLKVK